MTPSFPPYTFLYSTKNVPGYQNKPRMFLIALEIGISRKNTKIYGAMIPPHLLPIYVSDKLVVGEICYQMIMQGFNATLVKENKKIWMLILW
jgi:hypothetical protein